MFYLNLKPDSLQIHVYFHKKMKLYFGLEYHKVHKESILHTLQPVHRIQTTLITPRGENMQKLSLLRWSGSSNVLKNTAKSVIDRINM
jgi:hypothetical protein